MGFSGTVPGFSFSFGLLGGAPGSEGGLFLFEDLLVEFAEFAGSTLRPVAGCAVGVEVRGLVAVSLHTCSRNRPALSFSQRLRWL